jgi:hypothetical protein
MLIRSSSLVFWLASPQGAAKIASYPKTELYPGRFLAKTAAPPLTDEPSPTPYSMVYVTKYRIFGTVTNEEEGQRAGPTWRPA